MATTYKTPGVYIEEQPALGPIAGVGTSTAAFLGPALGGPTAMPLKLTNWTQFKTEFGGHASSPALHLPHAVQGFFSNGGSVCYVVRVGTAVRASLDLDDRGGPAGTAIVATARAEGPAGNAIRVAVTNAEVMSGAEIVRAEAPIASATGGVITLANAAHGDRFQIGDTVTIDGTIERVEVTRVRGAEVQVAPNLATDHAAGADARIADVVVGQTQLRLSTTTGVEAGTTLHLEQGGTNEDITVDAVNGDFIALPAPGVTNAYSLAAGDAACTAASREFSLTITNTADGAVENWINLSMDPRHSRYFSAAVDSNLVELATPEPPSLLPAPNNRPAAIGATALTGGVNDDPTAIGLNHYRDALSALEKVDDVNLVCVPDSQGTNVQAAVIAHCEKMADRFAILDAPRNTPALRDPGAISHRAALESARGYAAFYYPWIRINDPSSATGDDTILVPPSGHLAGVYARSDTQRGVHKAPANEFITGAVSLERVLDDTEQGELNIEGINVLRIFPGEARPRVWGARTTAPKDAVAWRYINVRRLFLFVEESIQEGIRWAVFEPNDLGLWKSLNHTISEFLTRVWRAGALFGASAEQAFYVKIDEELNPPSVRDLGQVIIEVGIAPVRPAEFVIVRIGMWAGGAELEES